MMNSNAVLTPDCLAAATLRHPPDCLESLVGHLSYCLAVPTPDCLVAAVVTPDYLAASSRQSHWTAARLSCGSHTRLSCGAIAGLGDGGYDRTVGHQWR
jgi:hypothetical protein